MISSRMIHDNKYGKRVWMMLQEDAESIERKIPFPVRTGQSSGCGGCAFLFVGRNLLVKN